MIAYIVTWKYFFITGIVSIVIYGSHICKVYIIIGKVALPLLIMRKTGAI
jgi:hypothetical protein